MSRLFVIIFVIFLGAIVVGTIVLGAFPPRVHRQAVEHVVPNDKFQKN